jgi:hypothetical protein
MAWSAGQTLEVRTTGVSTNGGGFLPGASGTDWSQQNGTQSAVADGVAAGTTTLTSATANFGTDVVGNLIYVQGGTGAITAGWYEIATRVNATTITVDRSTGLTAGTGVTLNIGGALDSIGTAGQAIASGTGASSITYIKSGTYNISSSTANVSGGRLSLASGGTIALPMHFIGYNTNRVEYNTDTKPILKITTSAVTLITHGANNYVHFENIEFDGNNQTTSRLVDMSTGVAGLQYWNCNFKNAKNSAVVGTTSNSAAPPKFEDCLFSGMSTAGSAVNTGNVWMTMCEFTANSVTSFNVSGGSILDRCLFYTNSGECITGLTANNCAVFITNCAFYNNSLSGVNVGGTGGQQMHIQDCIFALCAAYGINAAAATDQVNVNNCAFYVGGGTGDIHANVNSSNVIGKVTITANPFVAVGTNDYRTRRDIAAGASCLAKSRSYKNATLTTMYRDIGVFSGLFFRGYS